MGRLIALGASMLGLWLLLSGHYDTLLVSFGVACSVLVAFVAARMKRTAGLDRDEVTVGIVLRFLTYLPWLVKEVFMANLAVARIVLSPSMRIRPGLMHFRGDQKTDLVRFIYANSITLTPGTITVEVQGTDLTIHALVGAELEGEEESAMLRKMHRIEGG